jgi:AraC-like DNA-binding protein
MAMALSTLQPDRLNAATACSARRLSIQHYIDNHLANPAQGARSIAAAVGVSPRYVHRLLEESGETLGERILRLRLERCAQRLRDPASSGRSITEIAFDLAFADASYFARCFKRQYGMTPGEYRRGRG